MALVCGGITVGACVVNDYFDKGIDAINAPTKPLPSGAVGSDAALLLSGGLYLAVMVAACLMEPIALRCVVAFSAAATALYTPLFKKVTGIKNATVASVIALAPVAGALAAGAGAEGLRHLVQPSVFVFTGVMYREIVMDLSDRLGDAASGVWTLPVVLGERGALALAVALVTASCLTSVHHVLQGHVALWLEALVGRTAAVALAQGAAIAATAQLLAQASRIWASKFDASVVSAAVDQCLPPIAMGMIMLAAVA